MKTEQQISQPIHTSDTYVFPNSDKQGDDLLGCCFIRGSEVRISTYCNQTKQGIYLGVCADGVILLDIETSLGFALCEIHKADIIKIVGVLILYAREAQPPCC